MVEKSRTIFTDSGSIDVNWSTTDGVVVEVVSANSPAGAEIHFTVEQACHLTAVLLAACRTAGSHAPDLNPDGSTEMLALAERLRSDQDNLSSTDLRVAAGYLELLLKFGAAGMVRGVSA